MGKLRLVVADDNSQFLNKVVSLLREEFEIVETATDGSSALDLVGRWKPDIVVVGLHMIGLSGIEITEVLSRDPHGPPVVICSSETHTKTVESVFMAGAVGCVFKASIAEDLALAVRLAHQGLSFVSSKGRSGSAAEKFYKEVGRRVQELRKRAGYTQADMAAFGFSVRDWQCIEAGRPVALSTLLRVCLVFKIELEELLRPKGPSRK